MYKKGKKERKMAFIVTLFIHNKTKAEKLGCVKNQNGKL